MTSKTRQTHEAPEVDAAEDEYLRNAIMRTRLHCANVAKLSFAGLLGLAVKADAIANPERTAVIAIVIIQMLISLAGRTEWDQGMVDESDYIPRLESILSKRLRLRNAALTLFVCSLGIAGFGLYRQAI